MELACSSTGALQVIGVVAKAAAAALADAQALLHGPHTVYTVCSTISHDSARAWPIVSSFPAHSDFSACAALCPTNSAATPARTQHTSMWEAVVTRVFLTRKQALACSARHCGL